MHLCILAGLHICTLAILCSQRPWRLSIAGLACICAGNSYRRIANISNLICPFGLPAVPSGSSGCIATAHYGGVSVPGYDELGF